MTTKEYQKQILEELHKMDMAMAKVCELFEMCEGDLQEADDWDGVDALHEWFSNGYPFHKSFDELGYEVGSWGYVLETEYEESLKEGGDE